jgi:hypothetical protein
MLRSSVNRLGIRGSGGRNRGLCRRYVRIIPGGRGLFFHHSRLWLRYGILLQYRAVIPGRCRGLRPGSGSYCCSLRRWGGSDRGGVTWTTGAEAGTVSTSFVLEKHPATINATDATIADNKMR